VKPPAAAVLPPPVPVAGAWLACYDIASPRRLARVWRAVREFGVPLQYSVFWARLDKSGLDQAMQAVAARIDPRADDVRFYPLPENVQITGLGRDVVPLGVDYGDPVLRRFRREPRAGAAEVVKSHSPGGRRVEPRHDSPLGRDV
jgi:CRISPR-associated protein Cas2